MPKTTTSRINELLISLNDLLKALGVNSPEIVALKNLTPPLLVAILEGILRIPLSDLDLSFASTNKSAPSFNEEEDVLNLQRTKLFLGVLETDVLEVDVGLSNIDPRRLAQGKEEELLLIAELLCWVGKRHNIISSTPFAKRGNNSAPSSAVTSPSSKRLPLSPSTTAVTTTTIYHSPRHRIQTRSNAIMSTPDSTRKHRKLPPEEDCTSLSESFSPPRASSPPPLPIRPRILPESQPSTPTSRSPKLNNVSPPIPPASPLHVSKSPPPPKSPPCTPKRNNGRRISQPTSPSNSHMGRASPSVRYDGWISPVDEELELLSFESSRHHISLEGIMLSPSGSGITSPSRRTVPKDRSKELEAARRRNLQLLQERARLLEELAKLEIDE